MGRLWRFTNPVVIPYNQTRRPTQEQAMHEHVSLNMHIRGLGLSPTLAINEKSAALKRQGRRVYRLGLGQSPFPVPVPVIDALKQNAHQKDYLAVKGLRELRGAVAAFHRKVDQLELSADGVLVSPGSKELMFLVQLVYYGEIIIPSPSWVSYVPQARIIGREVKIVPTSFETGWKLSAEALEQALFDENDTFRPRLLVLNYPSNPVGNTYTRAELEAIAEVCRKYEVIVLSDEIYGQLHFKGEHVSIGRFYPEGTIISSGLSKWCGAGGWRLGTFTFPQRLYWLRDAMAAVASETYTSVCAPVQHAAVRAFKGDVQIQRYLWQARRILSALAEKSHAILADAGVSVVAPEGGFYLFPDFEAFREPLAARGIHTGKQLCERLLEETGVAVLPGEAFNRPKEELTARLAFVNFDGARTLGAAETIPIDQALPEGFVERWCEETLEAMSRIANWIWDRS
jgi:aspartate aminotransferase